MKKQIILFSFIIMIQFSCSEKPAVQVFVSGTDGHKSYRIPAIISHPDGTILAFAEGRVKGSGDFGDINIVLRRSTDNGNTWDRMLTVVDYDSLQAGNPAPVFDLTDPDYPDGRVFLFYNTGNNHEGEVRKGNGYREVWYITSADKGTTWSDPVNITASVHRLNKPELYKDYNFPDDWRSYANTPGHAFQFMEGKYKGRIVIAANHSAGEPLNDWSDYASHIFYTDDHGMSFKLGQTLPVPGSNEATAAAISGDRLILNARNQKGDIRARIVGISDDGGETWKNCYYDKTLPDPVCQGSIINYSKYNGRNVLAFSNPADTINRDNLTLRFSYDDGESWTQKKLIDRSPDPGASGNYAAYSDLVVLSSGRIGILYERDNYSEIVFKVVKPKTKY